MNQISRAIFPLAPQCNAFRMRSNKWSHVCVRRVQKSISLNKSFRRNDTELRTIFRSILIKRDCGYTISISARAITNNHRNVQCDDSESKKGNKLYK